MPSLICAALAVLALPSAWSIGQQSTKRPKVAESAGVVVLEEGDFEQVPDAVRGQSIIAPATAASLSAAGSSEVLEFDPKRNAAADVRGAVASAKRDGKRVLLEVGGNWCSFCKVLDRFFDKNPELMAFRQKNFVYVKINFSEENRNLEALESYPQVRGFPHFFVLDGKGELVRSQRVALLGDNTGYDPDRFLAFMKAFAAKK
jgi:thioredoxin-related protein